MQDWSIKDIENIDEQTAQKMAVESLNIKGHNIYFVDFGGYFGYSMLVFADGHHIHYANDYELHHKVNPWMEQKRPYTHDELRKMYIEKANNTLFTESEIGEPIADYTEYKQKQYYLHNYYPMRRDAISIFFIGSDEEREAIRKRTESMIYNPAGFCYMTDEDFINRNMELLEQLNRQRDKMEQDFDCMVGAFKYEMYNHEYAINWQADWDVIGAFGDVSGVNDIYNLDKLFAAAGFTEIQKRAYMEARRQYGAEQSEAV